MNKRGITLIEILAVVAIIGIISIVAGIEYFKMTKKYDVETDIKKLYSDLMEARARAYAENNTYGVWWGSSPFGSYEMRKDTDSDGDIEDSGGFETIKTVDLERELTSSQTKVIFTEKGTAKAPYASIYYDDASLTAEYSCITVSLTRIKMGEWNGSTCQLK